MHLHANRIQVAKYLCVNQRKKIFVGWVEITSESVDDVDDAVRMMLV